VIYLQVLTSPPVWRDGLEVCPLNKSDLQSLDFVVNRFPTKLFKTSNNDIISECRTRNYLCFSLPSELLEKVIISFWLNLIVINYRVTIIVNDSHYVALILYLLYDM